MSSVRSRAQIDVSGALPACCARPNGDLRKHTEGFGSPAHKLSSDVGRQASSLRVAGGGQGQGSCISRPVITVASLGSSTTWPCCSHPLRDLPASCCAWHMLFDLVGMRKCVRSCCRLPRQDSLQTPNRRGSPSGDETSGGPCHTLVTPSGSRGEPVRHSGSSIPIRLHSAICVASLPFAV